MMPPALRFPPALLAIMRDLTRVAHGGRHSKDMGKSATAFKDIGKACSGALSAATFEIAPLVNT